MVSGLLHAQKTSVGDEEARLAVSQKILLREPSGHQDVGGQVLRLGVTVPFPDDPLG